MLKLIFPKLSKFIPAAFFAALLLGLGLFLLPAPLARADGPTINLGDLPPGKVVTITFRASITTSLSAGATQVCNQATLSGTNFATIVTNDPTTPASNDPTCTPLDLPAVSIAAGATPSESGPANGSFTLALDNPAPAGGLTVAYNLTGSTATNPADYSLAAGPNVTNLTASNFTLAAGQTSATITIVPVDDLVDDDGETVQLNLSAGAGYTLGAPATATRTITDNDTRGVTLVQSGGSTGVTEGGATDTYTIQLDTVPTATVTITFNTGSQIDPITTLTFPANPTALNPQIVTVIATDDPVVEGNHSQTLSHNASGGGYNGVSISPVSAAITDNDIAITLAADQASVTEGNTGTTPISFTLTRTGDITRSSSVDFNLGGTATPPADYNNIAPVDGVVNFGAGVTRTAITLDVLGDFVDESTETITVSLANATGTNASGTGTISGSPATTSILDDDSAGISLLTATLTLSEPNTTGVFTLALTSQPTATVTIGLTSTDTTECTGPASASLDSSNWATGVAVTIIAADDPISDGPQPCTMVTAPTSSADPVYNGAFNPPNVTFTVNDDDVSGVSLSVTDVAVTEGGATAQYNVRLDTVPTAPVTISFTTGTQLNAMTSLTFPADLTALDPQTVTVTATDDAVVEGDHSQVISHNASGGGYTGVTIAAVTAHITDNDIAYTLVADQVSVTEGDTGSTPIAFTLTRTGDITNASSIDFSLSGTATTGVDYNNVVPAGGVVNFNAGVTQSQITLAGLGDFIDEADETVIVSLANAQGTNASGTGTVSGSPAATIITDDDSAGVSLMTSTLTITEPNTTAVFTLALTSQPTATVTIGLTSTDTTECSVPASVSLTSATWTGVPVTVTAVDDLVTDGPQPCQVLTGQTTSPDPVYSNTFDPDDVNVTVNDDDVPGIRITPTTGLTTTETGGVASFSVRLRTQPIATVTLTLTSSDTSEGPASPASLTFTTLNWHISQTVTVTGVNDDVDDGDQPYTIVTNDPTSSDPDYDGAGANPADVNVTNLDDDTAGFIVSAISGNTGEAGTQATFTIGLSSQPTATVTLPITSSDTSDTSEGIVNPVSLTFTPLDWNIPQTVTVTGLDDTLVDGPVTYTIQANPAASSSDPLYDQRTLGAITVVNLDNDAPINPSGPIYLPLIVRQAVLAPDLIVESMVATSSGVTLVLRNQGNVPVVDAFWVDVYFNPTSPPSLNQRWQDIASHGQVWGVTGAGLSQLTPGGSLTLTTGDAFYFAEFSSTPPLPVGANVFALADSVDFSTSYGAVLEGNEGNNLFGPVVSTAASGPASAGQAGSPSLAELPPRE